MPLGETPGLTHPENSYRPHRSTATLPLHSRSSMGAKVGGQLSETVLAANCPGQTSLTDLPTATKAHLEEGGVLSPHKGHTLSTQLG